MAEQEGSTLKSDEERYRCFECGRTFTTNQGLGAHRARSHGYRRDHEADSIMGGPPMPNQPITANGATDEPLPDGQQERQFEVTVPLSEPLFSDTYTVALQQFLPVLADELHARDAGSRGELVDAFLILYRDQANV